MKIKISASTAAHNIEYAATQDDAIRIAQLVSNLQHMCGASAVTHEGERLTVRIDPEWAYSVEAHTVNRALLALDVMYQMRKFLTHVDYTSEA